jgi:hypothetical protein
VGYKGDGFIYIAAPKFYASYFILNLTNSPAMQDSSALFPRIYLIRRHRDVPPTLSEHPEDLYDALEVEFNRAIIHNPNRKNKARVTHEERERAR